MKLFGKNKTENWIIKLFKITDNKTAVNFDMVNCILSTIDSISKFSNLKATDFDINYRNSRKTLNGFKKALQKQKEIVYSFVGFDSDKSNTYFTISNPMLNYTEQPNNSKVDICIQVSSEFIEKKNIEWLTEKLIESFDFEYGFITKLPENYDSSTERKVKKGLFSTSVRSHENDGVWTFHSVAILDGFIKRLYPINYLNKSHFNDSSIKEIISKNGHTKKISENITKWTLNLEEIEKLKTYQQIKEISILTPELEFLKTEKAKAFKDKMELKKASC